MARKKNRKEVSHNPDHLLNGGFLQSRVLIVCSMTGFSNLAFNVCQLLEQDGRLGVNGWRANIVLLKFIYIKKKLNVLRNTFLSNTSLNNSRKLMFVFLHFAAILIPLN